MPSKNNNTLALHATLAHEIKAAKKVMFKRHREGLPLRHAADQFVVDVTQRLGKTLSQISDEVLKGVPRLAQVNDKEGVELFSDIVDEAKLDERDRVHGEVNTLLTFFESEVPDFIRGTVVDAIEAACDHFIIDPPTYNDDPLYGNDQTGAILTKLFAKTRNFMVDHIKSDPVADLSWAISHIVNSPIAPERLRRSVGDFATDINELDESPEGIEKALGFGYCGYAGCPGTGDPLNPCPGPDTEGNHKVEADSEPEYVTATLENGEQVELYGDAVDLAKPKPEASPALAAAISEIINNPATPTDLYQSVADFVTDLRSGPQDNSPAAIHTLLTQDARKAANHAN